MLRRICSGPGPRDAASHAAARSARNAVIAAVRRHSKRCTLEQAAALGSPVVTEAEVHRALKHALGTLAWPGRPACRALPRLPRRAGTCAGCPVQRRGTLGITPRGFLTGAITAIYKKGCRLDPANYRPITLLDTDYRILGKVLSWGLSWTASLGLSKRLSCCCHSWAPYRRQHPAAAAASAVLAAAAAGRCRGVFGLP
jgi:hypothetical protein